MTVTEQDVRDALAGLFHQEHIDEWIGVTFRGGSLRGQTPAGLIAAGDGQRVLDFIEAIKDGAFL